METPVRHRLTIKPAVCLIIDNAHPTMRIIKEIRILFSLPTF